MDWFDDKDPFEDIINNFFGESVPRRSRTRNREIIKGEEEDRIIDFIENDYQAYVVFELAGYNERDISVSVDKAELRISAAKKSCDADKIADYLTRKLCKGVFIKKTLPKFIDIDSMKHTMRNGILEVFFEKK